MKDINFKNPDLHLHSIYSDGSDSITELINNVKKANIDIFALTDHDTYLGCYEVRKNLKEGDPYFIAGIEMSCEDDLGKYHILGYCYDVNRKSIIEAVEIKHNVRRNKTNNRIKYLENLGFIFTDEEIKQLLSNENPGKPHFVNLLLKHGYIKTQKEGFNILSKYKGNERILTPEEAINAILQADGIPVLAHGIKGDGELNLSFEEINERVKRLKDYGLMGLECYYSNYTLEQKEIMLKLAKKYNLLVTAGSDYHGTNKKVKIGETNNPDPNEMARFYKAVMILLDK